jgi:hypothetical protein
MAFATPHAVQIKPPFYLGGLSEERCGLHRYLDPDFVNRFKQDVQRRQFNLTQFTEWQNDERRSQHGREPVLRLPLHRAFHVICGEVVCEQLGRPALDPRKIASAGFVIRKRGNGREQAWMLEDGEALGWQDAPTELRDPDVHRRLCASGVLHQRSEAAAYSGEEVHPLHVLKTTDAAGKVHTLLFGYLPLGGFHYHRAPALALDAASQEEVVQSASASLLWPFGFRDAGSQKWLPEHSIPIEQGRPSKPMFELLRLLVNRYHLGETAIVENVTLEKYLAGMWLYDAAALSPLERARALSDGSEGLSKASRRLSLAAYLKDCFSQRENNPLARWVVLQERAIDNAGGLDRLSKLDRLPSAEGKAQLKESLWLRPSDAQELRNLLGQRLRDQALAKVKEIPLPKFTQSANDLYQIVPFVRSLNAEDKEFLQWADQSGRSTPFRVSAPFDPEASRPSLIQMPSLADLRRGLAQGASMLTPGDTFNLMDRLKLNKGVSPDLVPDGEPGPGLGIQWICSFSLPVITLVAMILLMIMVSLLNIVFFWMPWVRICLPFPKVK